MAEQLSEGRVRQVEILVDSRPGSILSSSEQPATTTAALQTAPIPQPAKVKREPEPVANTAVSSKSSKETIKSTIYFFTIC